MDISNAGRLWLAGRPRPMNLQGGGPGGGDGLFFTDDFNRADGALGNGWTGPTWAISGNKAINTPVLGPELIVNGGFGADSDWTKGAGWTIAAGVATGVGATGNLVAAVPPLTVGPFYQAAYTVSGYVSGSIRAEAGSTQLQNRSANGAFTGQSGQSSGTAFMFLPPTAFTGNLDDVSCKALTLSELIASREFGQANVRVGVLVTRTLGYLCGVVLNLDSVASPANFAAAHFFYGATGADFVRFIKCVGGTYTTIATTAVTYSAGAELYVTKNGTSYRIFYNGAQVGTDRTISDAGIISNTKHGMFNTSPLNSLDGFSVTNP